MADQPEFRSSVTKITKVKTGNAPHLSDESSLHKVSVRAPIGSDTFGVAFTQVLTRESVLIAGIRPDEWLLLGHTSEVDALLEKAKLDAGVSCIDITHGRVCLRLTGTKSVLVLAKLCSLDFHDLMFSDGTTGSASVARVNSNLIRNDRDNEPSYLILADRSFGQYLYDSIMDATLEFA